MQRQQHLLSIKGVPPNGGNSTGQAFHRAGQAFNGEEGDTEGLYPRGLVPVSGIKTGYIF